MLMISIIIIMVVIFTSENHRACDFLCEFERKRKNLFSKNSNKSEQIQTNYKQIPAQ